MERTKRALTMKTNRQSIRLREGKAKAKRVNEKSLSKRIGWIRYVLRACLQCEVYLLHSEQCNLFVCTTQWSPTTHLYYDFVALYSVCFTSVLRPAIFVRYFKSNIVSYYQTKLLN